MNLVKASIIVSLLLFTLACSEKEQPNVGSGERQQQERSEETAAQQQPPEAQQPVTESERQGPAEQAQRQPPDGRQQPGGTAPGDAAQQNEQQAGAGVAIVGTVEQTPEGVVIQSVDQKYLVKGKDLSNMIGKNVQVSGTLEQSGGEMAINVTDISEVG